MHIVELHQAETHLAQLIQEAADGENVVIASAGKPLAVLAPYCAAAIGPKGAASLPLWQGTVTGNLSRQDIYDASDG